MSSPSNQVRGKLLREDRGRPYDWPSYPHNLFSLYSQDNSTTIRCRECGHPGSGLRLDPDTEEFVHSDPSNCLPAKFSLR